MSSPIESPNTDKQKNNYSGYGCTLMLISSIVFVVGYLINTTFIINIVLVCCGVIGVIIGLVIMSKSSVKRPPANSQPAKASTAFNGIDQAYFNIVQDYGDKFYLFFMKLLDDPHLREELSNKIKFNLGNDSSKDTYSNRISMLITADILKVYQQLEYKFGVDKKESFALIYLFSRIFGLPQITFSTLPNIYSRLVNLVSDYLPVAQEINAKNIQSGVLFLLGKLINDTDSEMGKEYHLLLYRYASIIAKADGTITIKESEFLTSIMQPWNNVTNDSEYKASCSKMPNEQEGMEQLQQLVGLELVKNEVVTLVNFIKIQNMRVSQGMKVPPLSYHCIFTGNPGTGKTTVARIVACIYKELGILKKGHLVETDRSGLIAEYVGQTTSKTNKIIDSAMDGVLFIDEAYSLISNSNNDYGKEAIATLLKRMEDDRDHLVVILAGYTNEMKEFIDSNPGLQSRFNRYIEFKDYSETELLQIFLSSLKKYDYVITDEAIVNLKLLISKAIVNKDQNFGNARWARNLFEKTLEIQANRLASDGNISNASLTTITEYDIRKQLCETV